MDQLVKLPEVSSINDVKGIRQLYEKTEIQIRGLQALVVEAQPYGSLLVPVLLSKVPQELRLISSRKFNEGNWSLDALLKVFMTEVEVQERCNWMTTTPSTTPERKHPITSETLLRQRIKSTFCKQDHRCCYKH